jgi:serine/threonine protein kinase
MSVIISKDNFKIIQYDNHIFTIAFASPCPALIHSLVHTKLILGATTTNDYQTVKFKAHTVKTLLQYQGENPRPSIKTAHLLTAHVVTQLQYLLHENNTIIGYHPENIIVINDQTFAFLGTECVTHLYDEQIFISYPFSQTDFFVSPELLKIKDLPSYVHYKTAYFSLACLVVYSLLGNHDFYDKYLQNHSSDVDIMQNLDHHSINHTKLYWLLSRCFIAEPEKRTLLFI